MSPKTLQQCDQSPTHDAIGTATRCDEIDYFAAILKTLEPSQPIAEHRNCLLQNRSSVASHLPTMGHFNFLLR